MIHLVIGGAGFIGVNLAARLAEQQAKVVVLDDFSRRGAEQNAGWLKARYPDVQVVKADIRNDLTILQELASKAEVVYHLAAQVAVTTSVDNPRLDFEINLLGTLNVLEAVRQSRSEPVLLFSSTNKVYGQLEALPTREHERRYAFANGRSGITEDDPLDFHSPYGCSKGGADQYVRDYARIFGLKTVVFRQSCIYGPRQFGIEDQGWLAWFTIAAALGRPLTIYGTGKQVRDVLHVSDLLDLFAAAVEQIDVSRGQVYNVGGGPAYSLSLVEALDLLSATLGAPIKPLFAPARPGDQRIYVTDLGKVERELGWRPEIAPEAGIEDLVSWVRSHRDLLSTAY